MNNRPPRLPRWLLERALPADVREDISGDLEETFRHARQTSGARRAMTWYCGQVMAFSTHFLEERFRERYRHADMSTGISGIDLKLAMRMLVRYPGLTIVGVVGMAVGMAIAATAFSIGYMLMNPSLPLDEGDRVVAIQNWDVATNNADLQAMRDFGVWRSELRSIQAVGAFRSVGRNLIVAGAQPQPVSLAEMSASGFQVARVAPFMGRHLVPEDERPDAPPVVVIGFDVWERTFFADPLIVGRTVQLGDTTYTIVGVMPEGFAFPLRHSYWIPLKLEPSGFRPGTGPEIAVFGRLAAGATYESARAEAATVAQRIAAESPTHYCDQLAALRAVADGMPAAERAPDELQGRTP